MARPNPDRSRHGYTLLELAAVLPIILIVIFGTIDINTLLQGYSAIKYGVSGALRCVFTVNGRCVSASASTGQPVYDWYQSCGATERQIETVNFNARASWIEHPIYSYPAPSAIVLSDVRFQLASFGYRNEFQFPTQANYTYVAQLTSKPYLTGSDGRNPLFRYKEDRARSYPAPAVRQSETTLVDRSHPVARTRAFRVSAPFADLPQCFRADQNSWDQRVARDATSITPDFSKQCGAYPNKVKAVIWLKGRKAVDAATSGSVALSLVGAGGKDLGGQMIGAGVEAANFVPRGVGADYSDLTDPEISIHNEIELEYGKNYQLELRLIGVIGAGAISWQADELEVYISQFSTKRSASVPCTNRLTDTQIRSTLESALFSACGLPEQFSRIHLDSLSRRGETAIPNDLALVSFPALRSAEQNLEQLRALLSERGLSTDLADYYHTIQSGSGLSNFQSSCPPIAQAENYGVVEQAGSDGRIRGSSQALSICPPQLPESFNLSDAQNISWGERSALIPLRSPAIFDQHSCLETLSVPPELSRYPKLQLGRADMRYELSTDVTFDQSHSPEWYKINDLRYSCDQFKLRTRDFSEHSVPRSPSTSLFIGTHDNLGSCTNDRLREAAIREGMPENALLEPQVSTVDYRRGEPADSCTAYRLVSAEGSSERRIGSTPSSTQPAECRSTTSVCQCTGRFAGFVGGLPGEIDFDSAAAEALGHETVRAFFPRSLKDCEGDNCVSFEVARHQNAGRNILSAQAKISVPVRLLLGKSITLSYSDSRRWEGDLSGR